MKTIMSSFSLALVAILFAPTGVGASPLSLSDAPYVPGEVLVKFRARVSSQAAAAVAAAQGHSVTRSLTPGGLKHVKVALGESVSAAVAAYRSDPSVEYAQPNYIYHVAAVPNDPAYGQLWGFANTGQTIAPSSYPINNPGTSGADANVDRAWNALTDCSTVTVAVIDSGVNYSHEDLAANMWNGGTTYPRHGYDFVDGDDDPMDLNGHGTHVAGTIGAVGNNGRGVAGVCWSASIMAVRVMGAGGSGSTAGIIQGIYFAVDHGAKVINMSLGGSGPFDQAYSDAITAAQQADVAVIVAAGNEGTNVDGGTPTYPCAFTHPNLVCVAALDQAYELANFSNYGAVSVDIGAPGVNIRSTWNGTNSAITDALNGGWFGSSSTGTGWAYAVLNSVNLLVDPANFPNGLYANNTDDRVYKTFDLTGADVALLEFAALARVAAGDLVGVRCSNVVADPFSGDGVTLAVYNGLVADGQAITLDMTTCAGGLASVGFALVTDASVVDQGIGIGQFTIRTQALNATSYKTIDGTSMATPLVAGVATLLRARNPLYTAADVVSAIKAAAVPVAALAGRTTTGKAVDAIATLAYIRAPTGLTATVE